MISDQLFNAQLLRQQRKIKVLENSLYRWICFNDEQAIQSCMLLKYPAKLILPYQQFMMMWQLLLPGRLPKQACLLGLGGGDIIRYLRKHWPLMNILAIDKEPAMAKLASEHFFIQPDDRLTIEIAKAENFIKKTGQYDLTLIDLVTDNQLPDFLLTLDFWNSCHKNASKDGVIVLNFISDSETTFVTLLEILREVFGSLPFCLSVPEHKNVVLLINSSEQRIQDINKLKRQAEKLQKQSELPFQECVDILAKDNEGLFI